MMSRWGVLGLSLGDEALERNSPANDNGPTDGRRVA
jgi:hypothetical protein